jgi:hypothetical protein
MRAEGLAAVNIHITVFQAVQLPEYNAILMQWIQFILYWIIINFNIRICLQAETTIIIGWRLIYNIVQAKLCTQLVLVI